jgi:plasmid maintenance system antidote protein VapI
MVGQAEAIEEMKKRKSANPIKVLRALIQDPPMTQADFAEVSDIPVDSIRNLENDRRSLTELHLHKIKMLLGAEWDPRSQRWHLIDRPDVPYSEELYQKFQTAWINLDHHEDLEAHAICRRVIELMQKVESENYNTLFYRLTDFLEKTRTELHINGAREIFDKTKAQTDFLENSEGEITQIVRNFYGLEDEDILKNKPGEFRPDVLNFSHWCRRPSYRPPAPTKPPELTPEQIAAFEAARRQRRGATGA